MSNLPALDRLVACLAELPGIGRRTAEKMAIYLVRNETTLLKDLTSALCEAEHTIDVCHECGGLTLRTENPCQLCLSPERDDKLLCVVEEPSDIFLIEKAGGYSGRYHVLMGKLSPAKGCSPADLNINSLVRKIKSKKIEEVIIAVSTDMEGDATAAWIKENLRGCNVKISRLASGLPVGSAPAYTDPVTLARALKWRIMEDDL